MSPLDATADPLAPPLPEGLATAGAYPSYPEAFQHSVVILAMGEACWIADEAGQHRLLVEPAALPAAREQLARYDRESVGWPPPPLLDAPALARSEVLGPLLWSAGVLAIFVAQGRHPGWIARGALDAEAMFARDEWWRAATALFLHGDAGHVISNALGGILVFSALLTTLGRLRGWLLLALASVAGNLAVALSHHGQAYRSLGASTAIFAALGLLTGRAVRVAARAGGRRRWSAMLAPAGAGAIALALYGGGGAPQVDVPAHLTGFAAGALLGFAAGLAPRATGG